MDMNSLSITDFTFCAGFINLQLSDQMNLLQSTWLDILCLNLAYRSSPYKGVLVFADDFKCTEEESKKYGSPPEMDTHTRKVARKLTHLSLTQEEYVFLKAMLLLNPGEHFVILCTLSWLFKYGLINTLSRIIIELCCFMFALSSIFREAVLCISVLQLLHTILQ